MGPVRTGNTVAGIAFAALILSCGRPSSGDREIRNTEPDRVAPAAAVGPDSLAADAPTHAAMRHVLFHLQRDIILDVDWLEGELRPTSDDPVVFDDPASFSMFIDSGEIALSMSALERLMNDWVFAYDDAPLEDLEFEVKDGKLRLNGKLDKLIDIPFEIDASPTMTADGEIRIHPDRISTAGAVGNAIRKLLGLDLEEAVNLEGATGVRAEGNDLFLDPSRLLPPPRIEGRIAEIVVRGGKLVQRFGTGTAAVDNGEESEDTRNYMHFVGGTLGFGKLRMLDADLRVIDMDVEDPFDFSLADYKAQLIAGLSRTTESLGLDVFMPDLDDLRSKREKPRT
jgi:hypothetical protein